eukprot:628969_1
MTKISGLSRLFFVMFSIGLVAAPECDFCHKPLPLSFIDWSPFDCDHSFHQDCLLYLRDSVELGELFKKFTTNGGKCPVESCRIDFSKGKKHRFSNGVTYQGEWQYDWRKLDWKMHGKGAYDHPSICLYKGDFKDNKFDGVGIITRSSGSCYTGEWKDGKENGNGILIMPDESKYEGEFKDGDFHGNGKIIAKDYIYDGEWVDGKKHGNGILTWPNGWTERNMEMES